MDRKLTYEELEQKVKELEEEAVGCKRAEKDLIETKELLEHLIAAGPAVVYRCEPRGNHPFTFITENITTQLGHEPDDFTGDPQFWANHIHPEDKPRVLSELPRL